MTQILKTFERIIFFALIAMMAVIIVFATVDLGVRIVRDLMAEPILVLQVEQLLELFGFVMLILIGVELLETIKAYLNDHVIHVEIVLEVALIALARKVIILDFKTLEPQFILGIAALILALAVGDYLVRQRRVAGNLLEKRRDESHT